MTVSEKYVDIIKSFDIDRVFGVPGSFIMPLWESIGNQMPIVLGRHENGAVFMADGYSRITGKVGIVLTTAGPGITNSVTGIACAYQDSVPLVIISGKCATYEEKCGIFQNCCINDRGFRADVLLKPITKRTFSPNSAEEAIKALSEAFVCANTGRKGPVHISLPINIQVQEFDSRTDSFEKKENYMGAPETLCPSIDNSILDAFNASKRPIIICGLGVVISKADDVVQHFSKEFNIPVVSTIKGLTSCSVSHSLYWGCIGSVSHKSDIEMIKLYNADFVLVLGSSLSHNSSRCFEELFSNAVIAQIDIEEQQQDRYRKVDFFVKSDVRCFLLELLKTDIQKKPIPHLRRKIDEIKEDDSIIAKFSSSISSLVDNLSYIIPDAGNHWLDVLYWCQPSENVKIVTNNGLASMGYAIGASVGMSMANKGRIICVSGDGSFLMSGSEINAAVNEKMDIIFIVLNNRSLGRVFQYQLQNNVKVVSSTIEAVSISEIATGMGATSFVCNSFVDLKKIFEKCFKLHGVFVIEIVEDKRQCPTLLQQ